MDPSSSPGVSAGSRSRPRSATLRRAWPLVLAVLIIGLIGASAVFTRHGRAALTSAAVLPDMMFELPVRPVTWFTAGPIVERTFIDHDSGRILTDIYRPAGEGRHPAMVFSMGAPPMDLDDPRLVRLGEDAARAGIVMVVPFSNQLRAEMIEPEEIDALVGVFERVADEPYVDPERVGYIGVSVGASLALLAAADERIAGRVDYVVSFGGYFDAADALAAAGSGAIAYEGEVEPWTPDEHTVRVMARQIIEELAAPADRLVLTKAFVWGSGVTAAELGGLTEEGQAAFRLVSGHEPERTQEFLNELPESLRTKLELLSPRRTVDRLEAAVFIVHDRGDGLIPYVESRRLRDALAGREEVYFSEISIFQHVQPDLANRGGAAMVLDGTRLYFRLYQLLLRLS